MENGKCNYSTISLKMSYTKKKKFLYIVIRIIFITLFKCLIRKLCLLIYVIFRISDRLLDKIRSSDKVL